METAAGGGRDWVGKRLTEYEDDISLCIPSFLFAYKILLGRVGQRGPGYSPRLAIEKEGEPLIYIDEHKYQNTYKSWPVSNSPPPPAPPPISLYSSSVDKFL